jgi:hypothetical protein
MRALLIALALVGCGYQPRGPQPSAVNVELAFCGNGCTTSSKCSEGSSCGKCVGNTCTTETPLAPEPESVAGR